MKSEENVVSIAGQKLDLADSQEFFTIDWIIGGGLITTIADSLIWYFEGTPIANSNSQYYNPDTTGNFTVEVFGPEGCSYLSSPVFVDL